MPSSITLHISGDFACFTRPEMKVERVSYDVITPSAARGILEAIYWKPQIRWVIHRIHVLKPIRFTNIRRNEVGSKASKPSAAAMNGEKVTAIGMLIEDERQQRASTLLQNVSYVIEAHIDLLDRRFEKNGEEMPANEAAGKHLDMFKRRARSGQCFQQPSLGTREFPARFSLIEDDASFPASSLPEDQKNRALGWMLHDIRYLPATTTDKDSFLTSRGKRVRTKPRFFNAEMKNGIIEVPPLDQAKA